MEKCKSGENSYIEQQRDDIFCVVSVSSFIGNSKSGSDVVF